MSCSGFNSLNNENKIEIVQYKIKKYTSRLKNTTSSEEANKYQKILKKYHRINRAAMHMQNTQLGGRSNKYTNYDFIVSVEQDF